MRVIPKGWPVHFGGVFSLAVRVPLDFSYVGTVARYCVAARPMSSIYNLNHKREVWRSVRHIGALDKSAGVLLERQTAIEN